MMCLALLDSFHELAHIILTPTLQDILSSTFVGWGPDSVFPVQKVALHGSKWREVCTSSKWSGIQEDTITTTSTAEA